MKADKKSIINYGGEKIVIVELSRAELIELQLDINTDLSNIRSQLDVKPKEGEDPHWRYRAGRAIHWRKHYRNLIEKQLKKLKNQNPDRLSFHETYFEVAQKYLDEKTHKILIYKSKEKQKEIDIKKF